MSSTLFSNVCDKKTRTYSLTHKRTNAHKQPSLYMTHVVCMGSTYEDDCEEGDDIILCDGCNAEAHIRCLNMKVVRYVVYPRNVALS